jgi:hypothetical protein
MVPAERANVGVSNRGRKGYADFESWQDNALAPLIPPPIRLVNWSRRALKRDDLVVGHRVQIPPLSPEALSDPDDFVD